MALSPKIDKPLTLLRAIENVKKLDIGDFTRTKSNAYLLVEDPNPATDFYFSIDEVLVYDNGTTEYKYSQKPFSDVHPNAGSSAIAQKDFSGQFAFWSKLVTEYGSLIESQKSEEDSILEQYEEEEYASFELIDEDAETHSYPFPVQRYIDLYLADRIRYLESYIVEESLDETKTELVNEAIEEAKTLKSKQTQLTKQQVVTGLAKFWAKARKAGIDVFTEVRKEFFKESMKTITKKMLEDPEGVMNIIKGLLE